MDLVSAPHSSFNITFHVRTTAHCSNGFRIHKEVNLLSGYHCYCCCCVCFQILGLISSGSCFHFSTLVPYWAPKSVTNSYLGSIPVTNELHQVSKGSKSHLISGGDSGCSWVLVHALDPVGNEELQAIMLGEEVEC